MSLFVVSNFHLQSSYLYSIVYSADIYYDLFFFLLNTHFNNENSNIAYMFVYVVLCPALCSPMDCSPQSSSVQRILQARILEQFAISSYRASSQLRGQTRVSCIGRRVLHHWTPSVNKRCCIILPVLEKWVPEKHLSIAKLIW